MNAIRFFEDYKIDHRKHGEHHHATRGRVQINCPFCHDSNFKMGWHLQKEYFHCFYCGGHKTVDTVMALLKMVDPKKAYALVKQYKGKSIGRADEKKDDAPRASSVKLPAGSSKLLPYHRTYLRDRGLVPEKLEREWKIVGTGPVGGYKHRIIAPIYFRNRLVSYQGRDVTDKSSLRYKACKKEEEVIDHKHTLYGFDKVDREKGVIVVEGIFDVWKLGPGAVATYGTAFTNQQVLLIGQFSRRFIMFDNEPKAQDMADELAYQLTAFPGSTELIVVDGVKDAGSMEEFEAEELMKECSLK